MGIVFRCSLVLAFLPFGAAATENLSLNVPAGFRIETLVDIPNARSLVFSASGTLFVSTFSGKMVYAVRNPLGDQPQVYPIGSKLRFPNGVAVRDGDLYVAEANRLLRYADIEAHLDDPGEPEIIAADLPGKKLHAWKYIAFGPDGKLYMTVGAPCNVCSEPGYGLILRMDPDGGNREVYASGIRNSVGLDWHPGTGELWFTDNNRDMLGDDTPPGELNYAPAAGIHFGFPFCHGTDIVEPEAELAALGNCADSAPPMLELPAHVAALGLNFYTGIMFPEKYRQQIFIAEHGSWNRSEKIGYRVSIATLDSTGRKVVGYEVFADGWLKDGKATGRPADVITAPDGSLLVSDDKGGHVYRISYIQE